MKSQDRPSPSTPAAGANQERQDPGLQPRGNGAAQDEMNAEGGGLGGLFDSVLDLFGGDDSGCAEELAEAEEWVAEGAKGPADITGPSDYGGFSVTYDPNDGPGMLTVTQSVAVLFKDLVMDDGTTVTPHPDLPASGDLTALCTTLSGLPEPDRSAAIADYLWSDADKSENSPWVARLEPLIEEMWGDKHEFFLNREGWNWIGSQVEVDLEFHVGDRSDTDHMEVETYKTPEGESLRTYGISHAVDRGDADDARDEKMRLSSTALDPKEYDLLTNKVYFANNSDALDGTATDTLDSFIATFDGALGHAAHKEIRLDLEAHCSAAGDADDNLELAERRANAVTDYLRNNGFHNIETRVHPDARGEAEADQSDPNSAEDRRVDLKVDGGERMITAAHEWGHAFGLDDEYGTVGTENESHDLATEMTDANGLNLPGSVVEHNGGVMSYGNEVRSQHYATFHDGLRTVTEKEPWSLGPPRPKAEVEGTCS